MMIIKNIRTGFIFEIDDEAGAELLRTHKTELEVVKATKEALKSIEKAVVPTDEQRLLGEPQEEEIEEKYKDVEILEEKEIDNEPQEEEIEEKYKDVEILEEKEIDNEPQEEEIEEKPKKRPQNKKAMK